MSIFFPLAASFGVKEKKIHKRSTYLQLSFGLHILFNLSVVTSILEIPMDGQLIVKQHVTGVVMGTSYTCWQAEEAGD